MSLQRCKQETTSKEFLLWIEYLKDQLNHPSRSDYYAMQIAAEVRRKFSKSPNKIKLEDFKIPFQIGAQTKSRPGRKRFYTTREARAIAAQQQARVFSQTGIRRD